MKQYGLSKDRFRVLHNSQDRVVPVSNSATNMDFGLALSSLKGGARVCRSGWNGKGMYVTLQAGYPDGIQINRNTARATGVPEGAVCRFQPYLLMCTVDGSFVPWLASQTDLLAEDWQIVP